MIERPDEIGSEGRRVTEALKPGGDAAHEGPEAVELCGGARRFAERGARKPCDEAKRVMRAVMAYGGGRRAGQCGHKARCALGPRRVKMGERCVLHVEMA